jgi:hypothetical protein
MTAIQAKPGGPQSAHVATLRLLAGGLVVTATAFVIQTVLYYLVADTAFSTTLGAIDFALADGAVLVALIRLAADPDLRPFAASSAALTGLLALGDAVGVAAHVAGTAPDWLDALDAAQGNADAPLRACGTLLVLLTLLVLAQGHRLRTTVAVAWTVPVALVLSTALAFVGSLAEGGRGVAGAWVGWALEVVRPTALAALALAVLRAREGATPGADPPAQGAYRQPQPPAAAPVASPPPSDSPPVLTAAASGLRTLRLASLARIVVTAGVAGALIALSARDSSSAVAFAALATVSAATNVAVLIGLGRLLPLASARARPLLPARRLGIAIALRALGCLFDTTVFVGIALSGQGEPLGPVWLLQAIPIGAVASLLVASAMGVLGWRLDAPVVVRDARWVFAILIVAGGSMFAAVLADHGERLHESIVVCVLAVMCAAAFAVQLFHARLAGKARAVIAAEIARGAAS